ncbi:GH19782 [Drosophila grimshawi]|uniref:GH19782 n=2 Tax=Drosophila grimshawi TaxID=7222 RepID=B4J417_DROGR|nr:GH19782 [Drosophila grimshawi]
MDAPELSKYIETLPNQCICAYNSRHDSEVEYRKFKMLQLEAFFFGQFSERFKRFEIDPHNFEGT